MRKCGRTSFARFAEFAVIMGRGVPARLSSTCKRIVFLPMNSSAPEPTMVVEATDVRRVYGGSGQPIVALDGVSLSVAQGSLVVLMGASGSGKSTLLHLLAGLDEPTGGRILVGGKDLAAMSDYERTVFRRRHIGIVFQAYNLLPTLNAVENTTLPAVLNGTMGGQVERQALDLLELMGLQDRVHHRPQAMSGGEQQRVAIARAMINEPLVLLADEPTGNLDTNHSEAVWHKLAALVRDHGTTVVAVTHEPSGATYADRVLVMKDGQIIGEIEPGGEGHASLVAARYSELVD
ncbi:MAG: ABC transporter ATP-binding protein [Planctomycetota bacterium]|jgi:putative ABC transport system ATP-binding protein